MALIFLAIGGSVLAHHNEPIVTDRPDTAESSQTVGKNHFQIETSFATVYNTEGGVTTNAYNFPTLFRYGIHENWELRLESDMLQIQTETGTDAGVGFTDIEIGTKVHILDLDGATPSMGLLFHLNLPVGKNIYSSDAFEPALVWLNDWDLPHQFAIGTNIGFDLPVQDVESDKYTRFLYAVSLGRPFPGFDRWKFFVEFSGAIPTMSGKTQNHFFDTGTTYLVTDNFQMDLYLNVGLNRLTDDLGGGIGFSVRI